MGYLLGVQYSFVMEVILYFFPIRGKGSHEVQSVFKLYYLHTHSFLAIYDFNCRCQGSKALAFIMNQTQETSF